MDAYPRRHSPTFSCGRDEEVVVAEGDLDFGELVFCGVNLEFMAHVAAELVGDEEAHAGGGFLFAVVAAGEGFFEDVAEFGGFDADAVVVDFEGDLLVDFFGGDGDLGVLGAAVFDGVEEDLVDDEFEPFGVAEDGEFEAFGFDLDVVFDEVVFVVFDDGVDDGFKIDAFDDVVFVEFTLETADFGVEEGLVDVVFDGF